jgi:hypothetical protein
MRSTPTNAVEALNFLLIEWMDRAFPIEQRDIPALNFMWITLAQALCGQDTSKMKIFQTEIAQMRQTTRAGDPPLHELAQRLHELIDAGLREFFLIIAVRQAMEQLILVHFPSKIEEWKSLADDILPLQVQFAHVPQEMPGPYTTLRSDP